jgi:hypothetical protein
MPATVVMVAMSASLALVISSAQTEPSRQEPFFRASAVVVAVVAQPPPSSPLVEAVL